MFDCAPGRHQLTRTFQLNHTPGVLRNDLPLILRMCEIGDIFKRNLKLFFKSFLKSYPYLFILIVHLISIVSIFV